MIKKAILKRYQMTPTQSTFASYEKYTIPSYDQGIIAKMLKKVHCTSEDDCIFCRMDYNDVRKYAKQVSNYCYNIIQKRSKSLVTHEYMLQLNLNATTQHINQPIMMIIR